LAASIISVNVGNTRTVEWEDQRYETGIYKIPVTGRVIVQTLGLKGDVQADLRVHGGPRKAVYVYPSEHYEFWTQALKRDLPWGTFGENLTTRGLLEEDVHVGDHLEAGSAEFTVTNPRFPCFKLGIKLGGMDLVKRFQESGRSGFYMAVTREGDIASGDHIRVVKSNTGSPTIAEVFASEA
jgi:MOSC domain-containing protein YiiM